ncbi:hypothetical protein JHK87_052920 [Glycine soja]|nr:hypothetical protein JHK87_052920 [Glycine soja]
MPPTKKVMSDQEKHDLGRELESQLGEMPMHIIDFLKEHSSNGRECGDDEIEIDIDDLSDDTLFTLRKLLDDFLQKSKRTKQKLPAEGIAYQDDCPTQFTSSLTFMFTTSIVRAFFGSQYLSSIKESQPEVTAVWKIGQKLWLRDYAGVHEAIRGFDWTQELQTLVAAFSGKTLTVFCVFLADIKLYTKEMFQLLLSAYSTISIKDTALFLGMNEDDATNCWTVDPASQMLIVKKQPVVTEQKLDPSKLQRLTEYVFHLEH